VQPDMRSGLCDGGWVAAAIVLRWEHDAIGGVRARRLYWHSRASEWQLRQQLLERQLGARLVVHGVVRQRILCARVECSHILLFWGCYRRRLPCHSVRSLDPIFRGAGLSRWSTGVDSSSSGASGLQLIRHPGWIAVSTRVPNRLHSASVSARLLRGGDLIQVNLRCAQLFWCHSTAQWTLRELFRGWRFGTWCRMRTRLQPRILAQRVPACMPRRGTQRKHVLRWK
jgi:hypothetical protein